MFKNLRRKSRMKNSRFFICKKQTETIAKSAALWYNVVDEKNNHFFEKT